MKQPGGPEVLVPGEVETPVPGEGQILVRVVYTALNRADTLQRQGLYPPPPGDSEILGLELSGQVAALGEGVEGFEPGEGVFGLVGGGGYGENALLDAKMAMKMPEGMSFAQAAAISEVFFTANETVFELGRLTAGETLLVHAGGSGVGTAVIQMAKEAGARVLFTAGSPEKIEQAMKLGADEGINYKTHDFAEEVRRLTGGEGVDVIEDFLGASYLEKNISLLKTRGRLIIVALMGGAKTEINLSLVLRKRLEILGSVLRARTLEEKRAVTERFALRWLPKIVSGQIHPVIDSEFPWEQAAKAHQYMEENKNFGKILLKMNEPE